MNSENKIIGVGMAAIILKDGKVLMHKRKGTHAPGVWSFPGGHLEFNESFEKCIRRETKEESGLNVGEISHPVFVTNDYFKETDKHYITLFVNAQYIGGEPRIMEPEKCEEWKWFGKEDLPSELMIPIKNLIKLNPNFFRGGE